MNKFQAIPESVFASKIAGDGNIFLSDMRKHPYHTILFVILVIVRDSSGYCFYNICVFFCKYLQF